MKSAIEVSLESLKMEKSVKKREKKHARAKRQAERQAKGERARRERERQQARRKKQQARKLRNLANNLKRKEEVQRARQEASLDPSQSAESKKEEPERETMDISLTQPLYVCTNALPVFKKVISQGF